MLWNSGDFVEDAVIACSNSSITNLHPGIQPFDAHANGVCPDRSLELISTSSRSIKNWTMASFPFRAAQDKGVRPVLSFESAFTPYSINY